MFSSRLSFKLAVQSPLFNGFQADVWRDDLNFS